MTSKSAHHFAVGDTVVVVALKTQGIIIAQLSQGCYRVALRSIHLTVQHTELTPVDRQTAEVSAAVVLSPTRCKAAYRRSSVAHSIDLHGLTVDEATRALEVWLNTLILAKAERGKVIHGLGTGRVQRAVHRVLGRYTAVQQFRINADNPGETDVWF